MYPWHLCYKTLKSSWLKNLISKDIYVVLTWKIMIRSDHKFAHATTAQLMWHVQIRDLIGSRQQGWSTNRTNWWFNSSLPVQNGCHFADDIFKCIFMNEKFCILIQLSLKFISKGPIDNKSCVGSGNGLAPGLGSNTLFFPKIQIQIRYFQSNTNNKYALVWFQYNSNTLSESNQI